MLQKNRLSSQFIKRYSLLALLILPAFFHASANTTVLLQGPDAVVTVDDFHRYLEVKVPEQYRAELLMDAAKVNELLDQLYKQKVLEHQAIALNLDQSPEIKDQIEVARRQVLARARLRNVAGSDEANPNWELKAREEYIAHPERFQRQESVNVSHILISRSHHNKAEMHKIARQVLQQLKAGLQSFEDLAVEYSEDPTARKNGGSLGSVQHGKMVKPFEEAAFQLKKVGDISPIIETEFGLHIIKLNDRASARRLVFDEVKYGLIKKHQEKYREKRRSDFLNSIRDSITYVNTDAIQGLKDNRK